MSRDVWAELQSFGIEKDAIFETVEKTFVPEPNLPKSQFREHILRAARKITDKPFQGDDAIQISLIADEIWDRWPEV